MKQSTCSICGKPAAIHSPYSHKTVCQKCLKVERDAAAHERAVKLAKVAQGDQWHALDQGNRPLGEVFGRTDSVMTRKQYDWLYGTDDNPLPI